MSHEGSPPERRQLLKGIAAGGTALLAGCSGANQDGTTTTTTTGNGGGGGGGGNETPIKYIYPGYFSADAKDLLPMFNEQSNSVTVNSQKTPAESASTRKRSEE